MNLRHWFTFACALTLGIQAAKAQFDPFRKIAEHNISIPHTLAVADLNRDGHLDFITSAQHLSIAYNNGKGQSFTKYYLSDYYFDTAHKIASADLDNDGYEDIVASLDLGNASYRLLVWYGKADKTLTRAVTVYSSLPSGNFELVDVDADGLADILLPAGSQAAGTTEKQAVWLRNEGRTADWKLVDLPYLPASHSLQMTDMDGDGNAEALMILASGQIVLYAGAAFEARITLLPEQAFSTKATPVVLDMDGDGDLDIVALKQKGAGLVWFENTGALQFTAHHIDSEGAEFTSFAVGDLNNDGDADLVAGCWITCNILYFENKGQGEFTRTYVSTHPAAISGFEELKLGDVDADGYMDIVVTDAKEKAVIWYRNNRNVLSTKAAADLSEQVRLLPNPSTGAIRITSDKEPISRVLVYDALGRLIKEMTNPSRLQEIALDLASEARGIYQVRLLINDQHVISRRLVLH